MLCVGNAFAQTLSIQAVSDIGTVQPAVADSIVQITAESQGLQAVPYADLPLFGTYWEVMPGNGMAPLPCPPFDPTLPIYAITDNIFLVDATYGQVVVNPRRTAMMSSSSATTFTLDAQATAVANLIEQVQTASASRQGRSLAMASGLSGPPGFGDGGGGDYTPDTVTNTPPNYGTNLWIAQTAIVSGYLTGIGTNTQADIQYEIESRTNLMQTDWQSEGFINGSELTNWTPLSVVQGNRPILFLRLRSWIDSYNIGIPDWWQFQFFGTNGIDPDASTMGDGYSNVQKFQMGLNPTNYYNPNPPGGFFGCLDITGTNAFILWNPAPGPVAHYAIQRGIYNSFTGYTYSQIGLMSSNATFFEDVGAITNANAQNNIYTLAAVYPGGSLSATDTWQVSWYVQSASQGVPYGPPMPTNFYAYADATATNLMVSWTATSSLATNYLIERGISNSTTHTFSYSPIAYANTNSGSLKVSGVITNGVNWTDQYAIAAVYPGGGLSAFIASPINIGFTNGQVSPSSFYGYADDTGTNLFLTWSAAAGVPTNYIIFGGTYNPTTGGYGYTAIGKTGGSTNGLKLVNGIDGSGNCAFDIYSIFAVYTNGSLSKAAYWISVAGAPAPSGFVAYFDTTGTNVLLSWSAATGAITSYLIYRYDPLDYFEFSAGASAASFEDTNAVNTGSFDVNSTTYYIQANYQHGGMSPAAAAMVTTDLPSPTNFLAAVDATGTNVFLTWNPAAGAVTGYAIWRGVWNASTNSYFYSQVGTVGPGVTSFKDVGAIQANSSYNNSYKIEAIYPGGVASPFNYSQLSGTPPAPTQSPQNIYVSAQLVRNGSGRWQVMFSGLPTNSVRIIQLNWIDDFYDVSQQTISTANVTNAIYQIPDADAVNLMGYNLSVQLFGQNGEPGQIAQAGFLSKDAPYFVDGRQHMKQNLNFLIRGASVNQLFFHTNNAAFYIEEGGHFNQMATNFEEFSFLNHSTPTFEDMFYFQLDNLWPFNANYELWNYLCDTTRTNLFVLGNTNFTFHPNFGNSVPAPAILTYADPYWILQPGFEDNLWGYYGALPSAWAVSVNADGTSASLNSGSHNLFGLAYNNGCIIGVTNNSTFSYQSLAPGNNVSTPPGYLVDDYASWCAAPTLQPINYYFAPLINPGVSISDLSGAVLPGEFDPWGGSNRQPFPLPIEEDFNVTNQTPPIIASVGQPMIIGGWAKYSIQGSSPTKFAYLGQYFVTNIFLLNSNGVVTTNSAGVLSPYGEFFPLQTGLAQFVTMPDIDTGAQGTGVVRVVSLNADANHDGVMDFSYAGPDQNSASRPFRFWVNDNRDEGDFGGNAGIPGQGSSGDGVTQLSLGTVGWMIHGRRDLVDFFPVCLNISSLFQSNTLSAGISATDTNYQFILSQADGVLRFAYTSLTPTNYMAFLQDTNMSSNLAYASLTTISNRGVALPSSLLSAIGTSNQNIILVEAAAPTTQPLVLTIYHGTNQIAQTQLYLSITGVEQMFRSKTTRIL